MPESMSWNKVMQSTQELTELAYAFRYLVNKTCLAQQQKYKIRNYEAALGNYRKVVLVLQ